MRNNLLFLFLLLLLNVTACNEKEEVNPATIEKEDHNYGIVTFKFEVKNNPKQLLEDIVCQVNEGQITGMLPYTSNIESLVATFTTTGKSVKVNGIIQESGITANDFRKPVVYTIEMADGSIKEVEFKLHTFTGLPVLYINTENKDVISSKDTYIKGHLKIDANSRFTKGIYDGEIEIRGRGNTTWEMPKKPYKIKLKEKAQLLGMPADKEWALLANYADKSLMRNYVAFELSKRFGLSYTPQCRFVELFLNGEYMGNYLLTEHIKVSPDRVNITELSSQDISGEAVTGGYLMEIDQRLDEDFWFRTNQGVPFTIKSPEEIVPAQLEYIQNYIQQTEDAIHFVPFNDTDRGYANYINVETFINWALVNELLKNNDAIFFSSVYMYKDRNAKLSMGPVWDFDIALGNTSYNGNDNPEGWWVMQQSAWIHKLFQDPIFRQKVKERWNVLKANEIDSLFPHINETAAYLKLSQKENFEKWNILDSHTWPNAVVMGSYENEVQYLKNWLSKRIDWIDAELNRDM